MRWPWGVGGHAKAPLYRGKVSRETWERGVGSFYRCSKWGLCLPAGEPERPAVVVRVCASTF